MTRASKRAHTKTPFGRDYGTTSEVVVQLQLPNERGINNFKHESLQNTLSQLTSQGPLLKLKYQLH